MNALTEPSTGGNRLPALVGEIEAAHRRCKAGVREALDAALAAGRALLEVKGLVPHGQWQDWLKANVPEVSVRTAQRYMRAAEKAESDTVTFSSLRELLQPERPRPARPEPAPIEEPGVEFGAGILPWVPPRGCAHPFGLLEWTHLPDESHVLCRKCGKAVRLAYDPPARCILFTQASRLDRGFARRTREAGSELALRAEATAIVCNRADGVFLFLPGAGRPERVVDCYGEETEEDRPPSLWRSWLWSEFARSKAGAPA